MPYMQFAKVKQEFVSSLNPATVWLKPLLKYSKPAEF